MKNIITIGDYPNNISLLLAAISANESRLTEEQKIKRKDERERREKQRIIQVKILKNICPDCEGKLIRGKKSKKFDYKRLWTCKHCTNQYTSEGECL